jgi:hypothetical protein
VDSLNSRQLRRSRRALRQTYSPFKRRHGRGQQILGWLIIIAIVLVVYALATHQFSFS